MTHDAFDQLVAEAIDSIPETFLGRLRNVVIVVEDAPTAQQLEELEVPEGESMYALYDGVAQIDRDIDEPLLPDRIIIFQKEFEEDFGHDDVLLRMELARTIAHEIAHHFGTDDDRLEELGKY
ncbi:MAG: metallopeptidase family protein [Candidatus Uhrbacteria bacterium]